MKLNKGKFNPWQQERLGSDWLESSSTEKALWVLVDSKMNVSQQCALMKSTLNCISGGMADTLMEGIIPTSIEHLVPSPV